MLWQECITVNKNHYGLLAKYPKAGKVKTRLARDIGAEGAEEIYRTIAERVFSNTSPAAGDYFERLVFYSPPEAKAGFEQWVPGEKLLPQRGGDIGEIMWNAIRDLFESGAEKAVISGADVPDINRDIIKEAFLKLEDSDVVIGPAEDGGYYLIGVKALYSEIFEGIPWSTKKVFEETVKIIERIGLRYSTLSTLYDVDRREDIIRYVNLLPSRLRYFSSCLVEGHLRTPCSDRSPDE